MKLKDWSKDKSIFSVAFTLYLKLSGSGMSSKFLLHQIARTSNLSLLHCSVVKDRHKHSQSPEGGGEGEEGERGEGREGEGDRDSRVGGGDGAMGAGESGAEEGGG